MKLILSLVFCLFIVSTGFSQTSEQTQQEMELLTKHIKLDDRQMLKLEKVFTNRMENLKAIDGLRKQSEDLYRQRRRSVYTGAQQSIKLIMNNNQINDYENYEKELRSVRADKMKALIKQNASKEDILDAQYGIE